MKRRRRWWIAGLLLVPTTFGVVYFGRPDPERFGPTTVSMVPDTTVLVEGPPLAGLIDTTPLLQEGKGWPFQPLPPVSKLRRRTPPPVDTIVPVDSIFQPTPLPPRECVMCEPAPAPQPVPLWVLPPLAAAVLVTRAEVRTTIPEPSTFTLVVLGLVLLAAQRTRR